MNIKSKKHSVPDFVTIKRALLSVFDKTGLVEFASRLHDHKIELISTGGTAKTLLKAGLPCKDISDITSFPEILDGRVKTLHPGVHGGLLAIRDDGEHINAMSEHNIVDIDLVVVNLYPFETLRLSDNDYPTMIENIDIGGPAMIRSAAKNHAYVSIITDPEDYQWIGDALNDYKGQIPYALRQKLAALAYARTASYDCAIASWFASELALQSPRQRAITPRHCVIAPRHRVIGGVLKDVMRYGENPHQSAGFYMTGEKNYGLASAELLQGKQLSYNNINDTDAAFEMVSEFDPARLAACAIIKHANPCGVAQGDDLKTAYQKALRCDEKSAFGGIVAFNRELDVKTAREVIKIFTEVIIAPSVSDEARAIIGTKKNLRLLVTGGLLDPRARVISAKTVSGGLLVQDRDHGNIDDIKLEVVTKRAPTDTELSDLKFAFRVVKHVKSNAIVYAKDGATVGIGAGQMSRIDASHIAARKAQDAADIMGKEQSLAWQSVVASDAFFPFADGLISAIEAGATAIIQPGGSVRDDEVIAAANKANIAMVFTGMRHFKH